MFGAALAGACIVGVNATRRGAELARDIDHTSCQFVVADATYADLVDDPVRVEDEPVGRARGGAAARRRSAVVCAPVSAAHVGFHRRPQGRDVQPGADGQGHGIRLRPQGHVVLPDAALARKRVERRSVPRTRQRRAPAAPRPVLGDGVARRRPRARRDASPTPSGARSATSWRPRPAPTIVTIDCRWCWPRRHRRGTWRSSTIGSASPCSAVTGRAKAASSSFRRASPDRSAPHRQGPTSPSSTRRARNARRRSSIPTAGCATPGRAIGELVRRNADGSFEGYWNNPEADVGPTARRLVLVGRSGLPRRRRRVLVRGQGGGLAPGGLRELRGVTRRADRRSVRARRGGGRRRGARSGGGRPGHGGARTGGRPDVRSRRLRRIPGRCSPISAPSGHPDSSA